MGFGTEVSAPVFGGGMVFGPTPDQQLGGLTDLSGGRTAGSRSMSTLRFQGDLFSGYADRAAGGMAFGANRFMSGGPLWSGPGVPQFPTFGMGSQPAGAAPYAAPAAAPAPASSINASTPAKDVDEAGNKDDADKIEKLKDEYRLSDHGFTDAELDEIFSEIDKASEGNYTKFKSLLQTLPKKGFKEPELDEEGKPRGPSIEQQKSDWVGKYGEWHAKNIGHVDGTKVAQLVRDTASGEGVTMNLEKAPTPGNGFNRFKVTGVDGNSDVSPGDYLYYDPKSKNFYRSYDVQKKEFGGLVGPASETPVDGTRSKDSVTLAVGAGSDYFELTPSGTSSMGEGEGAHEKIVDSYLIGDANGKASSNTVEDVEPVDGNYYLMNDHGQWKYFSKSKQEVVDIPGAQYADGRLYLNKGGSYDPMLADDAVAYTARLRDAEEKLPGRVDAAKGEKVDQDRARVDQAWTQLEEMMGEDVAKKVAHNYDPNTRELTITCKPEDAKSVQAALNGTDAADSDEAKAREKKGNAILAELPRGAKVKVNEQGKPFSASANGFNRLKVELGRWEPKAVTVEAGINMSHLKGSSDVRAAVQKRIEREIENSLKDCYKPTTIYVNSEITLPEGKIDQKTWDAIKADVQQKYKDQYGCNVVFSGQVKNIAPEGTKPPGDDTKKVSDGAKPDADTDSTSKEVQAKTYYEKGKDFEAQPDYAAAYYQYNAANSIASKPEYVTAMVRCLKKLGKTDITADNIMERKDEINAFLQNASTTGDSSAPPKTATPASTSSASPTPTSSDDAAPAKPATAPVPEKTASRVATTPTPPAPKPEAAPTADASVQSFEQNYSAANLKSRIENYQAQGVAGGSASEKNAYENFVTKYDDEIKKMRSVQGFDATRHDIYLAELKKVQAHPTGVTSTNAPTIYSAAAALAKSASDTPATEELAAISNVNAKARGALDRLATVRDKAYAAARKVRAASMTGQDAAAAKAELIHANTDYEKVLNDINLLLAEYRKLGETDKANVLIGAIKEHRAYNNALRTVSFDRSAKFPAEKPDIPGLV
jgi:hypothetical protein